jgi:hypothetical protein
MADNKDNGSFILGVVVVLLLLYFVMKPSTKVVIQCEKCNQAPCNCNETMDIMADQPLDLDYGQADEDRIQMGVAAANAVGMGENDLGQNESGDQEQDMFYDTGKMMPKLGGAGQPEWTKTFENADNMLLQQNFIDTTDTERFQVTRSVCGRRYMSRDIRRVPTVTRDPRTVSSFQLPYINPQCALEYNSLHPGLD